jgi:pimeloyl-ACP methyl ester carboxylesterase
MPTPLTHCLPSGSLGTDQMPVTQVGPDTVTITDSTHAPVGGFTRRGICVFMHSAQTSDGPLPLTFLSNIGENFATVQASLNADGWIFVYPAYPGDFSIAAVAQISNLYNDCANDPGHGSRYVATLAAWWDHLTGYLASVYGAGRPIMVTGFSLGGHAALEIAINRPSSIVGYFAHCPPTIWSNLTIQGLNWAGINTTGMDLSATALNTVTVPGQVGYSKTDGTAGWGLSGDPGYLGVPQSNTNHMITNAIGAGQPVTRYESVSVGGNPAYDEDTAYPNGHLFLPADADKYCTPTTGWVQTTIDPSHGFTF